MGSENISPHSPSGKHSGSGGFKNTLCSAAFAVALTKGIDFRVSEKSPDKPGPLLLNTTLKDRPWKPESLKSIFETKPSAVYENKVPLNSRFQPHSSSFGFSSSGGVRKAQFFDQIRPGFTSSVLLSTTVASQKPINTFKSCSPLPAISSNSM